MRFGGLTTVVNSAVRDAPYLPVSELPLAEWQASLDANLTGPFLLLKHAIPVMVEGGGGSIILIASQLARTPKPGRAWYSSQKGALISLAKALAVDHSAQNIRANTLSPGPTADQRLFRQWPSEAEAHKDAATLFGRARHARGNGGERGVPGERRVLFHDPDGSLDRRRLHRRVNGCGCCCAIGSPLDCRLRTR